MGKQAPSIALDGVATLDKIINGEREIKATCQGCGHSREIGLTELRDLRDKVGGTFSLIGRRGRCEQPRCSGRTRFHYLHGGFWWNLWTPAHSDRWMDKDWPERMRKLTEMREEAARALDQPEPGERTA